MKHQNNLISIITPVLNGYSKVQAHINMVQSQTYDAIEHIIIDGGSTDGTVDVLRSKTRDLAYWTSEPDEGIYDAMNRGIDIAAGNWLFFSGVDDEFHQKDTLERLFEKGRIREDTRLVCGNIIRGDGRHIRSRFNPLLYVKNTIPHQGAFYRRDIFDRYRYNPKNIAEGVSSKWRISADYHLNLYLFSNRVSHQYFDIIISRCGSGKSMRGDLSGYLEEIRIRHLFLGSVKSLIFDLFSLIRFVNRRFYYDLGLVGSASQNHK